MIAAAAAAKSNKIYKKCKYKNNCYAYIDWANRDFSDAIKKIGNSYQTRRKKKPNPSGFVITMCHCFWYCAIALQKTKHQQATATVTTVTFQFSSDDKVTHCVWWKLMR